MDFEGDVGEEKVKEALAAMRSGRAPARLGFLPSDKVYKIRACKPVRVAIMPLGPFSALPLGKHF